MRRSGAAVGGAIRLSTVSVRDQKSQCDGVSRVFQRYDFKFYLQYFKFYCFNFCFKTLLGDYTDDLSGGQSERRPAKRRS
jgi:hypothetical protein